MRFTFKKGRKYIIKSKHKNSKENEYFYSTFSTETSQHVFTNGNKCFTINYKNRPNYKIKEAL